MKAAHHRQPAQSALELIEQAIHLLRAAPSIVFAIYYAGALPFVLGLLYFWTDMGRSPFADQHLAGAALGLSVLFLWMKFCQALFARRLSALLSGQPVRSPAFRRPGLARLARIFIAQAVLQPTALFHLPLALIPVIPFP